VRAGDKKLKKISHQAQDEFEFGEVEDNYGDVEGLEKSAEYVFVHFKKQYSFRDKNTKNQVVEAFNRFVASNVRDEHQDFRHSLRLAGFQEHVCFTAAPYTFNAVPYYGSILIGLALPYFLIFETRVARY
jgi:hypothetical protein